ncbi:MAG: lamin tail domain-containing protein [Bacilli bacterium]|nr:lamin tail domain-containing protein [Bacilli bacterium]
MNRKELIINRLEILLIITCFIALFIIIVNTPIITKYKNDGKLIISEVMPSNNRTINTEIGSYEDYIEIYNGYEYDIDLSGYHLSDDNFDTKKWTFPEGTIINKDSYLLVYATDKQLEELHTNFKLSKEGEVITLSEPNGKSLSKLYYLNTLEDTSYGYMNGEYVYFYKGTPGEENSKFFSDKPIEKTKNEIPLYITEYMNNNVSKIKNKNNTFDGMIEIYNDSDSDIDLSNYYLTNNSKNITKYTFPENIIIKAKSYLTIYTSGENKLINGEIHTNFKLNKDDKILILSDKLHNEIDKISLIELPSNISYGLYENNWHYYTNTSFGKRNESDYLEKVIAEKDIIINEVSSLNPEAIELKNITANDINLKNYAIGDKSGKITKLPNINIKANSYIVLYGSDSYSYKNNKVYLGFHINNSKETIYLYKDNMIIDTFNVGKTSSNISIGLNDNNEKVYYKTKTFGKDNSKTNFVGYTEAPVFSINGGYVDKGTKLTIDSSKDSVVYYTTDGSFPNKSSKKYKDGIDLNKTTVVKAIAYKDGFIESDIVSRTFFIGRNHDLPVISISSNQKNLDSLLINYYKEQEKKINFELYEQNGSLGVEFIGGTKLTGMDSRKREQKSMAIYLRKEYGLQEINYPLFNDSNITNYSSFTLRNAGEDPFSIRIQDTVLTYALNGQMDIDMQDYRAVVVYLNGSYYGLYNIREKLNEDYIKSNYGIEDNIDLIKYATASSGTRKEYDKLVNYIRNNDPKNKKVYEYLKTQIDMQELCNYLIVESYYGNTDQGNIRYWKSKDGKWRWMLYDLDWSLWNTNLSFNYTVLNTKSPAVTNLSSLYTIGRRLYRNSEFKDMYLKTFAYHLENTWNPKRMNSIVDKLSKEIETEMPYHINKWNKEYSSMNSWRNNITRFKKQLTNRYNYVTKNIKNEFGLSTEEYKKYFSSL